MANIGDSRTSLGYRNAQGGITAVSLTIDHKPDLPAEKVQKGARLSFSNTSNTVPGCSF
jgi:serine/threonine protein phosphatase PrpC